VGTLNDRHHKATNLMLRWDTQGLKTIIFSWFLPRPDQQLPVYCAINIFESSFSPAASCLLSFEVFKLPDGRI